ncbi:MAG: hypothetical protein ABFD64_03480 [Armatimonadota bacterium]
MKNRKNIVNEEPLWKKRRRERQIEAQKSRRWVAVVVILIVAALVLMIYGMVRGLRPSKVKKAAAAPKHTLSQIVDKEIIQQNGKIDRYVVFRVIGKKMRKSVDQKTFDSLEKGKEVLLTYDEDYMGNPKEIRGWSQPKFVKPVEGSTSSSGGTKR